HARDWGPETRDPRDCISATRSPRRLDRETLRGKAALSTAGPEPEGLSRYVRHHSASDDGARFVCCRVFWVVFIEADYSSYRSSFGSDPRNLGGQSRSPGSHSG